MSVSEILHPLARARKQVVNAGKQVVRSIMGAGRALWRGRLVEQRKYSEWLALERYRNGIQPRPNNPLATYTEARPEYQPGSQNDHFDVPLFKVPKSACTVYEGATLSACLSKKYLTASAACLAVHPQTAATPTVPHIPALSVHERDVVAVAPTASSRTVFALDDILAPHCLKLHFPFQITRSKRSLDKNAIQHSIAVSNLIIRSKVAAKNPKVAFFPESLGVAYGHGTEAWGFLIREMTPYPVLSATHSIFPLFALYSPDIRNPKGSPLLCDFISKGKGNPQDFILDRIFYPLLQGWADVFRTTGVVLEAHGQNTCIEVDDKGNFTRIVFRDFDTYVNEEMLARVGFSPEGMMTFKNVSTDTKPQGSVFSILFDQAMRVPFDRIADVAESTYGVKKTVLQKKCRLFLRDVFPEGCHFFPKGGKVYNYVENRVVAPGVKTQLVETGTEPVWR